jgi:hypothetical protein
MAMVHKTYVNRINPGGNYCHHQPEHPVLTPQISVKKGRGGLPLVLHKCAERLQEFYWQPHLLPSLNLANRSNRQQRTERREACIQTLSIILYYLNLTTLCVGIPTAGRFINLSIHTLRKRTSLGEKRIHRALHDLKAAGILTISQPRCKTPDGRWMGQVAVKAVSQALFKALGLSTMLHMARKTAAKIHKNKKLKTPSETEHGRFQLFKKSLTRAMPTPSVRKQPQRKLPPDPDGGLDAIMKKIDDRIKSMARK